MNGVAVMIIFTTILVIAVVASVIMLSLAAQLQHRAQLAVSRLNRVLSGDLNVDLNCYGGGYCGVGSG